jgi:hypothetical protein
MGQTIVLLPLAAFLHWGQPQVAWLLAALVIQIFGCEAATVAGNIPLNNRLATIDASKLSEAQADRIRKEFQGPGSPIGVVSTMIERIKSTQLPARTALKEALKE